MRKSLNLGIGIAILAIISIFISSCSSSKKIEKQRKEHIKAAYTELKSGIPEAAVTMEGDSSVKVVFPSTLLFEVNSTAINPSYLPSMAKMAVVLNKYPKTSVLITGYTDTTGTEEINHKLSWGRAESAKSALLNNEVINKRIYTWGFGSKNPIASNETLEGRQKNRRVEFVILYDNQKRN